MDEWMARIGRRAALAVAVVGPLLAPGAALADPPEEVWRHAEGAVDGIMGERTKADWAPVQFDGKARSSRLEGMIREAVQVLSASDAGRARERLFAIEAEVGKLREAIRRDRFAMAAAPKPQPGLSGLLARLSSTTDEGYRDRIGRSEAAIAALQDEAKAVRGTFAAGLEELGIHLDPQQIEGLLSMATAEDVVSMAAVFANMKGINQRLAEATVRTDESVEVARRYYGLHCVMLELAIFMHEEFLRRVDQEYIAKLDRIVADTGRVREEAQRILAAEGDPQSRRIAEANIAAQDLSLRAAGVYREHLLRQRASVAKGIAGLMRQRALALNTYRTAALSADLVGMLKTSNEAFERLMRLDVPTLRPFDNLELQREMGRLSQRLVPTS